jgi:hypothetical protein
MRLALASIAFAIVAGCASTPPAPVAATPAADGTQVAQADPNARKQICVREQPVGSAIPVTRCHYEETGVTKAMEMDNFRNMVNQTTRPRVPGSGT